MTLHNPPGTYTVQKLNALYRQMEESLNRIPGVLGSGLALYNPLSDNWGEMVLVQGHPEPSVNEDSGASWDRVSADYLKNFGIAVTRGRGFTAADNENSANVAVVNEAFVRRFFKKRADGTQEDPLDQHFGLDLPQNQGTYRIVGVVSDAKFAGFQLQRPARPMYYVPLSQNVDYKDPLMGRVEFQSHFIGGIMLLTNDSPGALEPILTRTLAELDRSHDCKCADDEADGGTQIRSGARNVEPCGAVWNCGADTCGDRPLWRDGVLGGATHK